MPYRNHAPDDVTVFRQGEPFPYARLALAVATTLASAVAGQHAVQLPLEEIVPAAALLLASTLALPAAWYFFLSPLLRRPSHDLWIGHGVLALGPKSWDIAAIQDVTVVAMPRAGGRSEPTLALTAANGETILLPESLLGADFDRVHAAVVAAWSPYAPHPSRVQEGSPESVEVDEELEEEFEADEQLASF